MFKQFCIAALAMIGAFGSYAQTFSIGGKVTSGFSDEGIQYAVVIIQELKTLSITDEFGNYQLKNIPPGTYSLEVKYVGHELLQQSVTVVDRNLNVPLKLRGSSEIGRTVIVQGTKANSNTPIAYSEVGKEEIRRLNNGQDIPYILRFTPSLVATSDAGTGIGYTGLWIRGSDPSRINVTVNDIPLNDPESQQVFWVNMPDFASNTDGIQIQRGVGTSTNGAASLGGTIKLGTTNIKTEPYAELNNTYGSFNTIKNTVMAGTGLIDKKYTFDVRLSNIMSDGYVDRATASMKSFYTSAARYGESSVLKLTVFGGNERTYQSWGGVPVSRMLNNRDSMVVHAGNEGLSDEQTELLLNSDRRYNPYTYKNEVDDYTQTHYQLHYSKYFTDKLTLNLAGHYTRGKGFYEQFRANQDFVDYGLQDVIVQNDTIGSTDLVRRRWLSNHFYGTVGSLIYKTQKLNATVGWAYNEYDGEHFGNFVWMQYAGSNFLDDRYYQGNSLKKDGNVYARALYTIADKWDIYGDVQVRNVRYTSKGNDNDLRAYDVNDNLTFFNPKAGLTWRRTTQEKWYASFAVGNKEPNRNDYIDAIAGAVPVHETLYDTEFGYQRWGKNYRVGVNFYNMQYNNQLVLTGDLNDVGAPIRMNVADSYRRGIELEGGFRYKTFLEWNANITFSQNKIAAFEEAVFSYDIDDYVRTKHENSDIAFSPSVIAGSQLQFHVWQQNKDEYGVAQQRLTLALLSKYVGKQYLDNTSNEQLTIDPYFINDIQLIYTLPFKAKSMLSVVLACNNAFDSMYSSNGYTYSYIWGSRITEAFYFPQAGRNYMASLNLRF